MKLIKRFKTLITADAHAVLDSIEDPHALLKQAMRDMASIIEENESRLKQVNLNTKRLENYAELFEKEQTKLNQDLALCFESDNKELSRSIVKKKLILVQRVKFNQRIKLTAFEQQKQLQNQLASNQDEYRQIAQQTEVLFSQTEELEKQKDSNNRSQLDLVITDDDIEMALLSEKSKWVAS
ncbi:MAG: hypothetical protein COA86_15675 [Kangiella sp.]|nr:MAG: hypothetical protein COA86_15675 [Kangiella sp.]